MFNLSLHDVGMIAGGFSAASGALVAIALIHHAAPTVAAWFSKEKASILAVEEKVAAGFTNARNAITNLDGKLADANAKVRIEFQAIVNGLHTRLVAVEQLVGIQPKAPAPPQVASAPSAQPVA